ncbi:MAG: hypothetical protein HYU51_09030 [Candidatus Rokubacteria bacterium]|nr:hypothetical protein [Candidatus Rokubacteria bacterium]
MKPQTAWIGDWRIGEAPSREAEVSRELLRVFIAFWEAERLGEKAKTTQRRYSSALHALGGYLVERANDDDRRDQTARDLLRESVELDEGPLIAHDNEPWQREIDMVCRKLHRYLVTRGSRKA